MNNSQRTKKLTQLALLVAVILIMAFTPLGYIKTFGLAITLIVVPVGIGAVILGPKSGAFLGGVFGMTSFVQSFTSPMGTALLAINPIGTFITCVITRIFVGWFTGLIYQQLKNSKVKKYSIALANLCCPLLNTLLFMSCLVIFFYNSAYIQNFVSALNAPNPLIFVFLFVGVNGLIEALSCFIVGSTIARALQKYTK